MEEGGNALFCLSMRDGQKAMDKSPGERLRMALWGGSLDVRE